MKYYKKDGQVYAFESDGSQDHLIDKSFKKMTAAQIDAHLNPPLTADQTTAVYTTAIQKRLDDFARTRGYDNILSAATYATSTVAKFAAEGQAAVNARDNTWAACYAVLAAVQAGERDMPTLEQLLAELPVLAWPEEAV